VVFAASLRTEMGLIGSFQVCRGFQRARVKKDEKGFLGLLLSNGHFLEGSFMNE